MRILLDTHALIWFMEGSSRFPTRIKAMIENEAERTFVSAASAWEIATKFRLGKLSGVEPLISDFGGELERGGLYDLPIGIRHASLAGSLPPDHKDPFDRMLCAQAIVEDLALVSADRALDAFGVLRLWDAA